MKKFKMILILNLYLGSVSNFPESEPPKLMGVDSCYILAAVATGWLAAFIYICSGSEWAPSDLSKLNWMSDASPF